MADSDNPEVIELTNKLDEVYEELLKTRSVLKDLLDARCDNRHHTDDLPRFGGFINVPMKAYERWCRFDNILSNYKNRIM